jgi:hypothetical protein
MILIVRFERTSQFFGTHIPIFAFWYAYLSFLCPTPSDEAYCAFLEHMIFELAYFSKIFSISACTNAHEEHLFGK